MTRSQRALAFIQTLRIRTRDRRIVRFRLNYPQRRLWAKLAPLIDAGLPIRLIILKARREGVSTLIEALLLWFVAEGEHVNALVTAHEKKSAVKIWAIAKRYITTSKLLSAVADVGDEITIGTSALALSTAGSPDSERGTELAAWHASEAAQYRDYDAIMTATMQAIPDSEDVFSIAVIESTANGMVGVGRGFYLDWQRAVSGESGWIAEFLGWQDDPSNKVKGAVIDPRTLTAEESALRLRFELSDEQLAWRRRKIAKDLRGNEDKFSQEYPAYAEGAFVQSGRPFFRAHHLLQLERDLRPGRRFTIGLDGKLSADEKGHLEIWKWPEPGHRYLVGSDSSMGMSQEDDEGTRQDGYSRSGAEVLDLDTQEQVAEYDAATEPHIMARHLAAIGRLYHMAILAPEVQASGGGGGREVLVFLHEQEYWNIHRWNGGIDKITPPPKVMLGWETNSRSRPRMIARVREAVIEGAAVIHSRRLFAQLKSFGENDAGRLVALAGHDDLLIAWAIALMSRAENFYKLPPVNGVPTADSAPNWKAAGIRVIPGPLSTEDFIARKLAEASQRPAAKDFLSL